MRSRDPVSFRRALLALLEARASRESRRFERLESLHRQGLPVYSEALFILTHLSFSERDARRHWKRLARHRVRLRDALGRDVGLRVAILDYFVNLDPTLKNPKVIELSLFQRTERSALSDGLTGLFNQGYFKDALLREVQRSRRQRFQFSVVLLDLDDFKRINDTHGHPAGDRVLARTAALVKRALREIDVAARYGGEEFALILPDTPRRGALVVAERIRRLVQRSFERSRRDPDVTLSGGIAAFPEDAETAEQLIQVADKCLYRAKAAGKNRIEVSAAERRRHERIPVAHRVTLRGGPAGPIVAWTKNVSESGLLLSLERPMPVGSAIDLLVHPRRGTALGLQGQVVRVEPPARGRTSYDVGLRLFGDEGRRLLLAAPATA